MASTKDMSVTSPEVRWVCWRPRQADWKGKVKAERRWRFSLPSPGGGGSVRMERSECATGWGDSPSPRQVHVLRDRHPTPPAPDDAAHRRARATLPLQGRVRGYADAVVTPPSMTMVWPVMKVEASEAR